MGTLTPTGGSIGGSWRPMQYGRMALPVWVSSRDAPYWVRVHVTAAAGPFGHVADLTLTPLPDGSASEGTSHRS